MDYKKYEDALANAEQDCMTKLCEILGLIEGRTAFYSVNKGTPECIVFDIGYPETGDVLGFPATRFHWRGQLDLYNRSRCELQKWLMRLVAAMPIATTQSTGEKMPEGSNVQGFRIAPMTQGQSGISTTELKVAPSDKGVATFTASVQFDIIFNVG